MPHHLHEAVATEALGAGLHVLLEKPLAPTLDACDRILATADAAGTVFMVAENAQYWPEVLTVRDLLADGAIGEVVTARAATFFPALGEFYGGDRAWRFDAAAAGGGVVIDTGSHWLRPLRVWLGEADETIAALGRPHAGMEGESLCRALIRFESGVVAAFDAMLATGAIANQPLFTVTGTTRRVHRRGLGLGEAVRRHRLEGHEGGRAGRLPAVVRGRVARLRVGGADAAPRRPRPPSTRWVSCGSRSRCTARRKRSGGRRCGEPSRSTSAARTCS